MKSTYCRQNGINRRCAELTPGYAAYAASKAHVLQLGEALHAELKPHGAEASPVSSAPVISAHLLSNSSISPSTTNRMLDCATPSAAGPRFRRSVRTNRAGREAQLKAENTTSSNSPYTSHESGDAAGVTDRLWDVSELVARWESYQQRRD